MKLQGREDTAIGSAAQAVVAYGGALLIGMTLVSFPASSGYLKGLLGFTDQEYGAIFLPQLVLAIVGALGSAAAVRRLSLKSMYLAALVAFGLSQACLGISSRFEGAPALWTVMAGTALFGFGFGFGGGPLNGIVSLLYPRRVGAAITALHMTAGLGLTAGPLVFAVFIGVGYWVLVPVTLSMAATVLFVAALLTALPGDPIPDESLSAVERPGRSGYFWMMILIAVLYAFSEGTLANWCVIYLQEAKGLSGSSAASALAAFWGGLTAGRLIVSVIVSRTGAFSLWVTLPPLMAISFLVIPYAESPVTAIAAFAFAGLACSAFFPLMVTVASEPYPASVSFIASMLTAALMAGVGIGSYVIGVLKGTVSMDLIYRLSALYPLAALVLVVMSRKRLEAQASLDKAALRGHQI